MSYQSLRESFIAAMAKHGMSVDVARLILRHAQTYHRLSERECNGDDWCEGDTALAKRMGYLVPCPKITKRPLPGGCDECGVSNLALAWVSVSPKLARLMGHDYVTKSSVRMTQIERRINELVSRAGEFHVGFQGDPRGWEVTIYVGGAHGPQVGVPRKG